jgi:hypothetical protein
MRNLGKRAVYVGIPASSSRDRSATLMKMAGRLVGKTKNSAKRRASLLHEANADINNAQLLFIFSRGSPIRNQPARPVLEPAIEFQPNRERISDEIAQATKAQLDGKQGDATLHLKRAGMAGRNAAQGWFTNPANGWAQNAPSTIKRKLAKATGVSSKQRAEAMAVLSGIEGPMPNVGENTALDAINTPGIDTGSMYRAITYVIGDDAGPADESTKNYADTPKEEHQAVEVSDLGKEGLNAIRDAIVGSAEGAGEAIADTGEALL